MCAGRRAKGKANRESMMKTFLRTVGAFALALTCSSAYAANNPSSPTETSSTGDSTITMTIPTLFMVSGISDIAFGTLTDTDAIITGSASTLEDFDTLCVYSNRNDFTYRVDLEGDGAGDTFRITHTTDNTDFITYRVYWNDDATNARGSQVGSEGGTTAFANNQDGSNQYDCGGTDNTRFDIEFDRDDILDVREGAYTGVLTIVISAPSA